MALVEFQILQFVKLVLCFFRVSDGYAEGLQGIGKMSGRTCQIFQLLFLFLLLGSLAAEDAACGCDSLLKRFDNDWALL